MPPEIRIQIYEFVLTGHVISFWKTAIKNETQHVIRPYTKPSMHGFRISMAIGAQQVFLSFTAIPPSEDEVAKTLQKLDLGLLLVCKTTYREARYIAFSANTFATNDLDSGLSKGLGSLGPDARTTALSCIRTLYLKPGALKHSPANAFSWQQALLALFPNLETLTLDLSQSPSCLSADGLLHSLNSWKGLTTPQHNNNEDDRADCILCHLAPKLKNPIEILIDPDAKSTIYHDRDLGHRFLDFLKGFGTSTLQA